MKIIKELYPRNNGYIDWDECIRYYVIENQVPLDVFWNSDFYELTIYVEQYKEKLEGIKKAVAFGYASAKKGKLINIFKKKKTKQEMEKMKEDLRKKFNL